MKSEFSIREYSATDMENVLALIRLNTPLYFGYEEEPHFIHYLNCETEYYFVVEAENKIVGCGGFNFAENNKIAKISWDIFHPQYQGKSLGTALLNYRINRIKQFDSVEKIKVRTSQQAWKFYEKNGFRLLETIKDYWAPGFDLYNMEYTHPEKEIQSPS